MTKPTYATVRDEAVSALQTVSDLIPEPKTVSTGVEQDPYGCSNPLFLSNSNGSFYTGHWVIDVAETLDIEDFIDSLPTKLGEGWKREELGIDVSFAAVDLVHEPTNVSIAVEDHSTDGKRVIDLVAISRCGV